MSLCQIGNGAKVSALGCSNAVDEHSKDCLGDNVSNGVTNLLGSGCRGTGNAESLHHVHGGVSALGHDSRRSFQADDQGVHHVTEGDHGQEPPDEALGAETHDELGNNVQEGNHGESPPHEATRRVVLDLAAVAEGYHDCGGSAESDTLGSELGSGQSYHTQQLNEEEGHCQEPINVTVGIVERLAAELHSVVTLASTVVHSEGTNPGVEDTEVVVSRDGRHQAGDVQGGAVFNQKKIVAEPLPALPRDDASYMLKYSA